jgi:ADP-ribose pyrophosphatase YjhB (NUDIX family)
MKTLESALKQRGTMDDCAVAFITNTERQTLVGNRVYKSEKIKALLPVWTSPGGRCDKGEDVEKTLRREVREEVDIEEFDIQSYIGTVSGAKPGDTVHVFHCVTGHDFANNEPEKFKEWKWIPIDEYIHDEKYSGFSPHVRSLVIDYLKKY